MGEERVSAGGIKFMNFDSISVHKHAKEKEFGQYPAILTSHLVKKTYFMSVELSIKLSVNLLFLYLFMDFELSVLQSL